MRRRSLTDLWAKWLLYFVPGAIALGTSCASDIRKSLVAAGLDFVEGSAGLVLQTVVPVEDLLSSGD
ncbi:MAG: hypothetical protein AABZ47_03135 [Planctomycetota bacterium]